MKHFLTNEERKKVQKYEVTILEAFDKICKKNKTTF